MLEAGWPLDGLKKLLGHSSITTTLRYSHRAPDHLQDAAECLNRLDALSSTKTVQVSS